MLATHTQAGLSDWEAATPPDGGDNPATERTTEKTQETQEPTGLILKAEASGAVLGLADIGLTSPKTVYVPGRYMLNKRGAFWITNKRVLLHDHPDILGFVPANGGYLIAGYKTRCLRGPEVGFYLVNDKGGVVGTFFRFRM